MKPDLPDSLRAIVIGASAGGVQALNQIFGAFSELTVPVLAVLHVPGDSKFSPLAYRVAAPTVLKEAEDKEVLKAGHVYFAPANYHLLIESDSSLTLYFDEPVRYARPSIDVLLESAAEVFGPGLIAVLLTGANDDGARGLATARRAGALTLVQDPATALYPTMPQAAIDYEAAVAVMNLDEISDFLRAALARPITTNLEVVKQ